MSNEPLARERKPIERMRPRLEALVRANAAPRCGARSKRTGKPCRAAAMPNGRCKVHGGKSTGPRTPEGLERSKSSANRLSACGRALRPWLGQTLLHAALLDPSGQASPAERQPCRTAGARFTAARVLGRGRRRAWSVAGEQTGNTAITLAKRRRNGRACGRQHLHSAICACWVISRKPDIEQSAKFSPSACRVARSTD